SLRDPRAKKKRRISPALLPDAVAVGTLFQNASAKTLLPDPAVPYRLYTDGQRHHRAHGAARRKVHVVEVLDRHPRLAIAEKLVAHRGSQGAAEYIEGDPVAVLALQPGSIDAGGIEAIVEGLGRALGDEKIHAAFGQM